MRYMSGGVHRKINGLAENLPLHTHRHILGLSFVPTPFIQNLIFFLMHSNFFFIRIPHSNVYFNVSGLCSIDMFLVSLSDGTVLIKWLYGMYKIS